MKQRVLVMLVVAFTVACVNDRMTGSSTVTGAYTLRTINGKALPVTTAGTGADKTEVLDDVITLYEGGTLAESGHSRITVNGTATNTTKALTGSYGLLGTSITFHINETNATVVGAMSASTMTFVESGNTSVFSK